MITEDFCLHCGEKCLKQKGKKMEHTKYSEVFSDAELGKAIETYNLYIANKEAFEKVYNGKCEYDENKSFFENAKDEINYQAAFAKIKASTPEAIKLAAYIFEKAVCPTLEAKGEKITEIEGIPEYGETAFSELDVKIEKEDSQISLFLDCTFFRIGGAIVKQENGKKRGNRKEEYEKISCKNFSSNEDLEKGFVISEKKFEFTSKNPLSSKFLNETIIPQIRKDCENLIDAAYSQTVDLSSETE